MIQKRENSKLTSIIDIDTLKVTQAVLAKTQTHLLAMKCIMRIAPIFPHPPREGPNAALLAA